MASRKPIVSNKEIWAAPNPKHPMVWAVCPYLRNINTCRRCPEWEKDKNYGKVKRGCRAMAEEACRVVHAAKVKYA